MQCKKWLRRLRQDDSGQDLVEYVLLVALLALAMIAGVNAFSAKLSTVFSDAGSTLQGQIPGSTN